MTLTLQQHFNLIKEGKGNKSQFLRHAKQLFPQYFNQYTNFDTATQVLKSKQIISEAVGGVVGKGFDIWDWKKILAEETKAVEKETSKEVLDNQSNAYDNKNTKNADNVNFNEIMKGFYVELKDPKNAEKTGDELKDMVVKNLSKDPLYYTKNGEFGVKDLGYTTEVPGLGEPKEPKGKYKSSGYGDIEKEIKVKANVQDSLGDKEAKTSMPKKVKEMPDKGVTGAEKKMKLQEGYDSKAGLGKKEQDKISDLSKEEKKALYNDLTDAVANINDKDFKDKALYAKAMKDAKTKVYKKYNILEENQAKETSDEKIVRYEKYTYTLDDKEVKPEIAFYNNILKAELDGKIYRIGEPIDGKIELRPIKGKTGIYTESVKENTEDEDIFLTRAEELYVDAIDSNNMSEDEAYDFLENQGLSSSQISSIMNYVFPIKADIQEMTEGEQKLRSLIHNIIKEELEEAFIDPSGELQDFSSEENKYDIKSFINDIKEKLEYMSIPEVNSFIKNNIKSIKEYYDIMMESNISYGFTPEEFKIHAGALVDSLVRKAATLNEEFSKNQNDPSYIANYIAGGFADYIMPGSEKFTYGPDEEGTYHLEFQLGFDDLSYNTPEEEEEELQNQIGGSSGDGPGQAFSRTNVSYDGEKEGKYIFSVHQRGGYDI